MSENSLNHLGIILDGNRRWAVEKGLSKLQGHVEGVEALRRTIAGCIKNQIKYLTVYVFSTENWQRTEEEVGFLMKLAHSSLSKYLHEFKDNHIKINIFGDLDTVKDQKLADKLRDVVEETKDNTALVLNVCFNYGGRAEIIKAVQDIIKKGVEADEVDEKLIEQNLYSAGIPDPDMIVRTSGEQRLSGFLTWQSTYSELYFMDLYWPDFDEQALDQVIAEFSQRQRRFGK